MKFIYEIIHQCIICGASTTELLCSECSKFIIKNIHICSRCASFILKEDIRDFGCRFCTNKELSISYTYSPFIYSGAISKIIKDIKYKKDINKAVLTAQFLSGFVNDKIASADAVTYIPMRKKDEFLRGFNQSRLFAEAVSKKIKKPLLDILIKNRKTQRQAELSRKERETNIINSFNLKNFSGVEKIVIVDDVITTMATVNCAAEILKKEGKIKEIYAFSLSRDSIYFS